MVEIVAVSPRASIVGVPATSGRRWVWGEWRVVMVSSWKLYVRMACEVWEGDWYQRS